MGAGIAKPVQTATQNMGGKGSAGGSAAPSTAPQSGMVGKGGAAQQPQWVQNQPQAYQPVQNMGGKGGLMGQLQGMTGPGAQVGQNLTPPPAQQGGLYNTLMGVYGGPMNNPNVPQAEIDALQGLTPGSPAYMDQVKYLGSLGYNAAPQPGGMSLAEAARGYSGMPQQGGAIFGGQMPTSQSQADAMRLLAMQKLGQVGQLGQPPLVQKPMVQGPISSGGIPAPQVQQPVNQQDAMRQRFMNQFGQRQVGGAPFEQRIGQEDERQKIQRMLQQRGRA